MLTLPPDMIAQRTISNMKDVRRNQQLARKTQTVAERFVACYGFRPWRPHGAPIEELVATILSQHTSDTNSSRAFAELKRRFPTWPEVVSAPAADVAAAIQIGGLANIKAPRIQAALRAAETAFPAGAFDALNRLPVNDARAALLALPGIGPKTASCVLLFSLGIPAMPVDTHVHRVARRIGILELKANAGSAHEILESRLNDDLDNVYSFHVNAVHHGRQVCKARNPLCGQCCINDICDYVQNRNYD